MTKVRVIILLSIVLCFMPTEMEGQKRQRARTKAKTTQPAKKTTGNSTSSSAEAKKKREAAAKEIKLTEAQIRENDAKMKKGLTELGKLNVEIESTNKKITELNGKISGLGNEITSLEAGISQNEKDLEKLRSEYLKAVKKMRVSKKNRSNLAFIFSSKSVNQAMRRMRYLREFSAWRGRQTDEINVKTEELKTRRDELAKAREEQNKALALQRSSQQQLSDQHSRQEVLVAELKKNGQSLERHLARKKAEAAELDAMVSRLIAEEQRKAAEEEARRKAAEEEERRKAAEQERLLALEQAKETPEVKNDKGSKEVKGDKGTKNEKSSKKGTEEKPTNYADARKRKPRGENKNQTKEEPVKTSQKVGGNFSEMRGRLPHPSSGSFTVVSPFGRQTMPDLPDVEYDNPGIDAETDAGASALAVYKGKVSGVYLLPGYNTVVIVNHGNYYTVYGNIASPSVKTGDPVEMGSNLGRLALKDEDNRHSSIHFEVWRNREKLNPQDWIK